MMFLKKAIDNKIQKGGHLLVNLCQTLMITHQNHNPY